MSEALLTGFRIIFILQSRGEEEVEAADPVHLLHSLVSVSPWKQRSCLGHWDQTQGSILLLGDAINSLMSSISDLFFKDLVLLLFSSKPPTFIILPSNVPLLDPWCFCSTEAVATTPRQQRAVGLLRLLASSSNWRHLRPSIQYKSKNVCVFPNCQMFQTKKPTKTEEKVETFGSAAVLGLDSSSSSTL